MEPLDQLEQNLQTYLNEFCKLAEELGTADDYYKNGNAEKHVTHTDRASQLVHLKREMIGIVQQLSFLDKTEDELFSEMKTWENLNKQSIERAKVTHQALEGVETAIEQAVKQLQQS